MTNALTETTWLITLDRIKRLADDQTTRTLAALLYEIIKDPTNVDEILDIYGRGLLLDRP